ncbi:MAG: nucleotide exchange factor GrpE [Synechococcales cyanobacterium K44_A2020_017]|nr:nucleotide exchange factor GrpE [Synechococcales cyanobacterium K32_A2020_035]MBF2096148.1 nucleotide exchange factor GrpE [Synechococcales cyanobacterium K44_A2020_017]
MGDEEKQVDNGSDTIINPSDGDQEYDIPVVTSIDDLPDEMDSDSSPSESPNPDIASSDEAIGVEDAPGGDRTASEHAAIQAYESKIAALAQEVESLKAHIEDRNLQYVRLGADFENFRKRTSKEREEQEERVKCSTVTELLPVVDNFERARSQIKPQTDAEMGIHKSYQGVYKQLVDCLKRLGVAPMRAEGVPFDPNLHNAVMREQTDAYEEGIVMEELMRGYQLGERVLRHAMVKVAAAPDPVIPSDENSEAQGEQE